MQYQYKGFEIALSIYTLRTQSIGIGIYQRNYTIVHLVVCTRQITEFNSIKSCKTIGHSTELHDDFGSICFVCIMRMKESRQPYQYRKFKNSKLIRKLITEKYIMYILSLGHGRRMNSTVSNHTIQQEIQQNFAMILELAVSYEL